MAWVTPSTRSTGDIVTAAIWNQDAVYNPQYLKGQAGAVTIEDRVNISDDANFYLDATASIALFGLDSGDSFGYDRSSNFFRFYIGAALKLKLESDSILTTGIGKVLQSKQNAILIEYVNESTSWAGGVHTETGTWANAFTTINSCVFGIGTDQGAGGNEITAIRGFSWSTTSASLSFNLGGAEDVRVNFIGIGV